MQVAERLINAVHPVAEAHFGAFFSSELGGIVTDPALMVIHMDDHMVHRGHGVFDTVLITDGHLYQLPQHIERFKCVHAFG
jgi:4-amino-4-deoxychorismate lyase